ncbi:MAG TPA: ribbon-helix-helix domain-containing protein [Alphaproteobacteria bacterium]
MSETDQDAAQDAPARDAVLRKRSVLIAGHKTSVSLEGAFWDELRDAAAERDMPLSRLIEEIDTARGGNLSSAIRLFVLDRLRRKAETKPA